MTSTLINKHEKMKIPVPELRRHPEILAAFLGSLASFGSGIGYGWSSPVGLKLASNNTDETPLGQTLSTGSEEFAWISSLIVIGVLIGPFIASYFSDRIGRKWTLMMSSVFFVTAGLMFIFGYNVWLLYIGRVFQGIGVGFVIVILPLYIGEISSDDIRGPLGTFFSIFLSAGTLYAYAIGAYSSYYVLQYAYIAVPVVFFATFIMMPESPFYLISKQRNEDAIKALVFLRNKEADKLQDEIKMIEELAQKSEENKTSIMAIIKNRGDLKAFLICWGLISFQQLTGLHAVLLNAQIILDKANTGMDTGLMSIFIAFVELIAGICTPLIANRLGRKTILLVSISMLCLGLFGLGAFFYIDESGEDTSSLVWLPLTSLSIFMFFSFIGIVPIPFAIIGEIFSTEVKSTASAILAVNGAILSFAIARWYPSLVGFGTYFPFWLYGGLSAFGIVFVLVVVVETKGLSLKEIQDKLNAR